MSHYSTLEISEDASSDDIKKAYRKLASKHHPDKGGDTAKFQEIQKAYEILGDPQKKEQYDYERIHGHNQRFSHGGMEFDVDELSRMFGVHFGRGGFAFRQGSGPRQPQNKDITIRAGISLKQSYTGTQLEARFRLPSGKEQTVSVDVPAGVHSGQHIRYQGLGDDSIKNAAPGNLDVQIIVEDDPVFTRNGMHLHRKIKLSALEAMIGCTKEVTNIDDTTFSLKIRPGIAHGTMFEKQGAGFKDIRSGLRGCLVLEVEVEIPAVTDENIIKELTEIYAKISPPSE